MTNKVYDYYTNRMLTVRPEPFILNNVFSEEKFLELKNRIIYKKNNSLLEYNSGLGRYSIPDEEFLSEEQLLLTNMAKSIFNSNSLVPTYCVYSMYHGTRANLPYHVDDNACTYTIDLCISYKTNWPIYINNKEFILEPNQAVCYYGEDQYHWRNKFPDPANNEVEMIFFHFAEPDHWYFTKGVEYQDIIVNDRKQHQGKIYKYLSKTYREQ